MLSIAPQKTGVVDRERAFPVNAEVKEKPVVLNNPPNPFVAVEGIKRFSVQDYYMSAAMHPTTELDRAIAEEFFGRSVRGPEIVPHYSGAAPATIEIERKLAADDLLEKYLDILADQCGARREDGTVDQRKVLVASCVDRCIAALVTIGSKWVQHGRKDLPAGVWLVTFCE